MTTPRTTRELGPGQRLALISRAWQVCEPYPALSPKRRDAVLVHLVAGSRNTWRFADLDRLTCRCCVPDALELRELQQGAFSLGVLRRPRLGFGLPEESLLDVLRGWAILRIMESGRPDAPLFIGHRNRRIGHRTVQIALARAGERIRLRGLCLRQLSTAGAPPPWREPGEQVERPEQDG